MTTIPGRLHIDKDGRLQGPAAISWNDPWPTPNGTPGGFAAAYGGVIHTEVGYEHSVIHEFSDPAAQASAFFSIGMDGHIHQYAPLGRDFMCWTQAGGNPHYRGVEHEDQGNPAVRMPPAQLDASAQVFEAMSAYDGWPLAASDNPDGGRGILFHSDGGASWGGHDCPGTVRRGQRGVLITLAKQIRAGHSPDYVTNGQESLLEIAGDPAIAKQAPFGVSEILRVTAIHYGRFPAALAAYINAGNLKAPMEKGIRLRISA